MQLEIYLHTVALNINGKCMRNIRPYMLEYGDLVMQDGEAYHARLLYPQYVTSFAKCIIDNDMPSFRRITKAICELLFQYGINKGNCSVVLKDYFPKDAIAVFKELLGANIEGFKAAGVSYDNNSRMFTGIRLKGGNALVSDGDTVMLQLYEAASNYLLPESFHSVAEYNHKLTVLQHILKNLFGELPKSGSSMQFMTSDPKGSIIKYNAAFPQDQQYMDAYSVKKRLLEKVSESKKSVMLLSPFSFGKSTIANALLGIDMHKADYLAETSVITVSLYAPVNALYIKYKNKAAAQILFAATHIELKDMVLKYLDRENGAYVEKALVFSPEFDTKYASLIDSPGLFSVYENHDDVTTNALQSMADAIVFVLDPVQLENRQFVNFIKTCLDSVKLPHVFVINKRDTFHNSEETLIENFKKILRQYKLPRSEVIAISALFGYVAKAAGKKSITLEQIQRMKGIFYEDDSGMPVSGRGLRQEHIPGILNNSNIAALENLILTISK